MCEMSFAALMVSMDVTRIVAVVAVVVVCLLPKQLIYSHLVNLHLINMNIRVDYARE